MLENAQKKKTIAKGDKPEDRLTKRVFETQRRGNLFENHLNFI